MVLNEISGDEQERIRYENALIAELDHNSDIYAAEERGKIEGKIETAKNLLTKGLSIDLIAEATELAVDKVKQLQREVSI